MSPVHAGVAVAGLGNGEYINKVLIQVPSEDATTGRGDLNEESIESSTKTLDQSIIYRRCPSTRYESLWRVSMDM